MADIPHFQVPFDFKATGDGSGVHALVNEQDSVDDIFDCVELIVRWPKGFSIDLPDFGVEDMLFELQPVDLSGFQSSVIKWEPRARILLSQEQDKVDALIARVRVEVFATGGTSA